MSSTSMRWPCLTRIGRSNATVPMSQTPQYRSQLGEDTLLHRTFFASPAWDCRGLNRRCHPHPPSYLELGANDGVSMSNTYFFEESLGWNGMLIEALPKYCDKMANSRCQAGRNVVACGAVCTSAGETELVSMDAMSGVPSMDMYPNQIDAWKNHAPNNPEWQRRVQVPCAPLSSLLARGGLHRRRIDLFSLDVEGSELHVLNTLDWNLFRFGVLILEISCIDDPRGPLQNRTRDLLRAKGYSFLMRHRMDEIWGDLSVDWVRDGAQKINGGTPQFPQPCMRKKPRPWHHGYV